MKIFRIGNNVDITWNIVKSTPLSSNLQVYLIDKYNHKQTFDYSINDNVITGTFYGKDQVHSGAYRLLLIENEGLNEQSVVDYLNAFSLSTNLKSSTSVGNDAFDNCDTETIDITSTISTDNIPDDVARIDDIPTKVSQLANDANYTTKDYVDDAVSKIDADIDLTPYAKKSEVEETYQVKGDYALKTDIPTVPTKVSELENDKGYLTEHQSLAEYETIADADAKLALKADKTEIPTKTSQLTNDSDFITKTYVDEKIETKFDNAKYNTENKTIDFLVGDTVKASIDATDFIKDGMVNTVSVVGTNLVISFNTDSGKDDINIPITDLFNADNYYTKTQTDEALSKKLDIENETYVVVDEVPNYFPYNKVYNVKGEEYLRVKKIGNLYEINTDYLSDKTKAESFIQCNETTLEFYASSGDQFVFNLCTNYDTSASKATLTWFRNDGYINLSSFATVATADMTGSTCTRTINGVEYTGLSIEIKKYNDKVDLSNCQWCLTSITGSTPNYVYVYDPSAEAYNVVNIGDKIVEEKVKPLIPTVPTKVSELTNDSGYLTEHQSLSDYETIAETDSKDATTLTSAKTYTDTQVSSLTWSGTQTEYDALETKSDTTIYMITEE